MRLIIQSVYIKKLNASLANLPEQFTPRTWVSWLKCFHQNEKKKEEEEVD
jgi:hypothetical protein